VSNDEDRPNRPGKDGAVAATALVWPPAAVLAYCECGKGVELGVSVTMGLLKGFLDCTKRPSMVKNELGEILGDA
jgi:hypothetical protein